MANESVNTQIRLSAELHQYIQTEASRIGITNNAFLIILCELGGKVWDSNKRLDLSKLMWIAPQQEEQSAPESLHTPQHTS